MKPIMFLTLAGLLMAAGCIKENFCIRGEGRIEEVVLELEDFQSINLRGSMNVEVTYGETQSVVAVGHTNIINHLERRVHEGMWEIGLDQGCYTNFEITVYITMPQLEKVTLTGSGDILVRDFRQQGNLDIKSGGSGKISLESILGGNKMEVVISGSGPVQCYTPFDTLKELTVTISGSGSFKGYPARTETCKVNISGSGSCETTVENYLDAHITGSGSIYYRGRPVIDVSGSGSGRVVSRN